jgi:general secretion pathway protein D
MFRQQAALVCTTLMLAQPFIALSPSLIAQDTPGGAGITGAGTPPTAAGTNAPVTGGSTNAPAVPDEVQLSFQGANIDMVVQWLSQTTGKSVIKHPQVNCQLTIVSSKKLSSRDALNLVYRGLSLEGFSAIESSNSILIVPEGREPKMNPEFIDASTTNIPQGRQRLMKIFQMNFVPAGDMREKIKAVLSEKAGVDINERGNQLIITDYNDNIALVGNLIKSLDTDKRGDQSVRVIALKHVSAQDLVREIAPLYQKLSGKSQNDAVEIAANERSNSLIILSGEANFKAIETVVTTLDTEDAQEKAMQSYSLKNADAEDVAKQLKDLMSDQDKNSRYPYYFFGSSDSGRSSKKPSVVADRRRNTIIVQAPPAQLESIGHMVAALDEPVGGESLAPRIYPLKYVSAVDIEEVLNELFLKKQPQRNYFFFDESPEPTADRDVGRLYGKVRITSEPYSNAIILTSNSRESLAAVEDVLKQLDQPSPAGESTFRVTLKFAKAPTVANSLNILFAKAGAPPLNRNAQPPGNQNPIQNQQPNQTTGTASPNFGLEQDSKEDTYFPWLGGAPENTRGTEGRNASRQVSDLVGRVRAVPDPRSNSLLISANVHYFPQINRLIEELDAPTAQVLIEARIVEVSSDFMDRLGTRWSPDGSKTFTADDYDNSVLANTSGQYQKGFGGNTTVNSGAGQIPAALASLRSGVLSSGVKMDFLVQFLKKNVAANVLAEPQINIEDNQVGKLFVGSQVPTLDYSLNNPTGASQGYKYKDVGVILEVIPHINISGDVSLKIRAESSTIQAGQLILGGAVFDTRSFKTDVTAKSGETLVLGGIIQKQVSDTVRKVPILGDIPGLGWAFKKKDKSVREVELLVFLRPRVVRTAEDARKLMESVEEKAPLIKKFTVEGKTEAKPKK